MTESIMERLRFSRAEIDAAVEMVRQHMVFKDVPRMRVAKLKRFMARPTFEEELATSSRLCKQPSDNGQLRVPLAQTRGVRKRTDHPAATRPKRRFDRTRNEARSEVRGDP